MNLTEFVEESLSQILAGIRAAQAGEGGGAVGAEILGSMQKGLLFSDGTSQFSVVEFDVSVVAETKGGAKGGIRVWSVGLEGEAGHSTHHSNKVKFAVQVRIPPGDKAPRARIPDNPHKAPLKFPARLVALLNHERVAGRW